MIYILAQYKQQKLLDYKTRIIRLNFNCKCNQGGKQCLDLKNLQKLRGIGKELIIEFGKRILSG